MNETEWKKIIAFQQNIIIFRFGSQTGGPNGDATIVRTSSDLTRWPHRADNIVWRHRRDSNPVHQWRQQHDREAPFPTLDLRNQKVRSISTLFITCLRVYLTISSMVISAMVMFIDLAISMTGIIWISKNKLGHFTGKNKSLKFFWWSSYFKTPIFCVSLCNWDYRS